MQLSDFAPHQLQEKLAELQRECEQAMDWRDKLWRVKEAADTHNRRKEIRRIRDVLALPTPTMDTAVLMLKREKGASGLKWMEAGSERP
eukprot:2567757-Prymnesium_polylepis.1